MTITPSWTPEKFLVPKDKVTKKLVQEFYDWACFNKVKADPSMELLNKYIKPETKVLNLGCGSGAESVYFAERGCFVVGVDISPKVIKLAKEQTKLSFIVGDMVTINFKQKFNIVLIHDSLEHVFPCEQKTTLLNAINHLEKDGVIFVKSPTPEYIKKVSNDKILEGHYVNPIIYQVLDEVVSPEMVRQTMKENGLEIVHDGFKDYINNIPKLFIIIGRKV